MRFVVGGPSRSLGGLGGEPKGKGGTEKKRRGKQFYPATQKKLRQDQLELSVVERFRGEGCWARGLMEKDRSWQR